MVDRIELHDGHWNVVVAPALGGGLLACEYDGVEVLKPVAQPAGGGRPAMRCCHYPLVPFSNRVEASRFSFDGQEIQLIPNVAGSPHAMHGHGWQSAWQATDRDRSRCVLVLHRDSTPDWPWPYRASQAIALDDNALSITLAVENLGADDMPCGLGFHPFLPREPDARLAFEATRVGNRNAGAFPTERVAIPAALDFHDGPRVSEREGTDHCFEDWSGRAVMSGGHAAGRINLESCAATRFVILYIPVDADYYCVEPVTHAVNAMNLADAAACGWWRLGPREQRRISMRITRRDS